MPHSDIHGSKLALSSPWLFAECHVFHRLLTPRHPPNALVILEISASCAGINPRNTIRNYSKLDGCKNENRRLDLPVFLQEKRRSIATQAFVEQSTARLALAALPKQAGMEQKPQTIEALSKTLCLALKTQQPHVEPIHNVSNISSKKMNF